MSEDKHLEEKEKLEAEISRSLSVVKMKEAHKQIEDIEKSRKQASIKSICERIAFCLEMSNAVVNPLVEIRDKNPNQRFNWEIKDSDSIKKYLDTIMAMYESIYLDLQKTIDIKKEDFSRLFSKMKFNFTTYKPIITDLTCLNIQLADMKNYCLRLL
jgi:hypothetical protein